MESQHPKHEGIARATAVVFQASIFLNREVRDIQRPVGIFIGCYRYIAS